MSDVYQVITPENVEIDYELAGIGSRFLAVTIDIWIQAVFTAGLLYGLSLIGFDQLTLDAQVKELTTSIIGAIIITLLGIIWLGYYVILETAFHGQTFGKRLLNIRVRKELGYAPNFWDILLRNMIRPIDFIPSFYAVGFLTMFLNNKSKRLGDFAAGTIVVKEIPRRKMNTYFKTQLKTDNPNFSPRKLSNEEVEIFKELLPYITQEDYLLLQNLKSRQSDLTNYNILAANALQKIYLKMTGKPSLSVNSNNAPAILENLLGAYEKNYFGS